MGVEKLIVVAEIGKRRCAFLGAKYWYGDKDVKGIIGVKPKTDKDTKGNEIEDLDQSYKKYMIRLTAVCAGNIAGIGNQAQRDKKFNINFYCHPDKADDAMLKLPGKSVDRGAGLGRLTIQRVYRPRRVTYI
ncbi:hypothetical protein PGN35_000635 [Nodosilinea sp. PGN35]|uniref:hypothetical protein n=1 Tax=Nodosilinea sp. PGN35 TaxID=3020489 RepID=UPI0023B2F7D2|nr:hypothetical protein [Nodosilinea sp. TSF1-S3]MDF0369081.1 hypothetical protein [Nodosilinea sp. TSF1-S3]